MHIKICVESSLSQKDLLLPSAGTSTFYELWNGKRGIVDDSIDSNVSQPGCHTRELHSQATMLAAH